MRLERKRKVLTQKKEKGRCKKVRGEERLGRRKEAAWQEMEKRKHKKVRSEKKVKGRDKTEGKGRNNKQRIDVSRKEGKR